jgi:hypothetical protein
MSTIVTRADKGSPLTNTEVDANFSNLNTDKAETDGATLTNVDINSGTIDGVTIGGASAGAGTFTTLQADTSLNVDGTVTADGLTVDGEIILDSATGNHFLKFYRSDSTINAGNALGQILFGGSDEGDFPDAASIQASAATNWTATSSATQLDFFTTRNTTVTPVKRLTVADSGDISFYEDTGTSQDFYWDASTSRLGLGVTAPDAVVHVFKQINYSGTNFEDNLHFLIDNGTVTNHTAVLMFNSSGTAVLNKKSGITGGNYFSNKHGLAFFGDMSGKDRSANPDAFIDSSGNVGIGTTSPETMLHLSSSSGSIIRLEDQDASAENNSLIGALEFYSLESENVGEGVKAAVRGYNSSTDGNGELRFYTGNTTSNDNEVMRIDSSGNVGIGTASPAAMLDVSGDALINGLTIGEGAGSISSNVAVGQSALSSNTTGVNNAAVGCGALFNSATGDANTAIGESALRCNTASSNTAVGRRALYYNTSGAANVAVGERAFFCNDTGGSGVAVGFLALQCNTTGNFNVGIGLCALRRNSTGTSNTAIGGFALLNNTTASNNIGIGSTALLLNTGANNIAIGVCTMRCNTTGASNTAVGCGALFENTTASCNTAVGRIALACNTGANNTAVGYGAGCDITTGSNLTTIGYLAIPSSATATNEVTLGNADVTSLRVPGVGLGFDTTDGFIVPKTITAVATTGAQTINKTAGSVNFAAAGSSLVVTNSFVDANSVILATVATDDATMKSVAAVASAGSFTLHANAAATAETRVNWVVVN